MQEFDFGRNLLGTLVRNTHIELSTNLEILFMTTRSDVGRLVSIVLLVATTTQGLPRSRSFDDDNDQVRQQNIRNFEHMHPGHRAEGDGDKSLAISGLRGRNGHWARPPELPQPTQENPTGSPHAPREDDSEGDDGGGGWPRKNIIDTPSYGLPAAGAATISRLANKVSEQYEELAELKSALAKLKTSQALFVAPSSGCPGPQLGAAATGETSTRSSSAGGSADATQTIAQLRAQLEAKEVSPWLQHWPFFAFRGCLGTLRCSGWRLGGRADPTDNRRGAFGGVRRLGPQPCRLRSAGRQHSRPRSRASRRGRTRQLTPSGTGAASSKRTPRTDAD